MNNIPDFAMQVQEVQRQMEAQSDVTAQDWKDSVQRRYYDTHIKPYKEKLEMYIHGGTYMSGKGINDLLVFLNEKMQKMEELTGVPADVQFMCSAGGAYTGTVRDNFGISINVEEHKEVLAREGVVHNEKLERDYWNEEGTFIDRKNGTRPGQYSNEEIKKIMDYRDKDDFYKDFKY